MSFLTSREQVAPQGIGQPVRRREDARLLTGGGRFADETNLRGQLQMERRRRDLAMFSLAIDSKLRGSETC